MEKKKPIIAVLLVLLLSLGAYFVYQYYSSRVTGNITATGTIEATRVELCTKSSGAIKTLMVKAGDTVAAGKLVAELQRNDLVAQRERDAIALAKAEDQLNDLQSGAREPEIDQSISSGSKIGISYFMNILVSYQPILVKTFKFIGIFCLFRQNIIHR